MVATGVLGEKFEFLNLSKPSQARNPKHRRIVRRNATLYRSRGTRKSSSESEELSNDDHSVQVPVQSVGLQLQFNPIVIKPHLYSWLKFTECVIGPELFPLKSAYRFLPAHQMMMCLALQDEKVLNSGVAIAALCHAKATQNQELESMALVHNEKALIMMREQLDASRGEFDPGIALCMLHLASVELVYQNRAGWQMHMDAIRKMISHSQSANATRLIQFTILEVELLGCYGFDIKPSLLPEGHLPSAASMPDSLPESVHALQMTLESHIDLYPEGQFALDPKLVDILLELERLSVLADETPQLSTPELMVQSFTTARISFEYKLLHFSARKDLNPFSKAVALAAQIYANKVLRTFKVDHALPHILAKRLENSLHSIPDLCLLERITPSIVLWVATMGTLGAQQGDLKSWFTELVHHCHQGGEDYFTRKSMSSMSWPL